MRRRWWVAALVLAWVLVLVAAGAYAARHGRATVREQTTIAQAVPTVDRAVAEVATAADAAGAVPVIGGYVRADDECRVTAARSGQRYERTTLLYTAAGREGALLDALAARLPAAFRVRVRHLAAGSRHTISGDAGFFVRLVGGSIGPGQVRVTADTGCRVLGGAAPPHAAADDPGPRRAAVEAVFAQLVVPAGEWSAQRVSCPAGGTLWTVQAQGPPGQAPTALPAALAAGAPPTEVVLSRPDVHAVRAGPVRLVATVRDARLAVAATTGCGG